MNTKTCILCGEAKPFDPRPSLHGIKASGFKGGKCWDCHLLYQRFTIPQGSWTREEWYSKLLTLKAKAAPRFSRNPRTITHM